MNIFIEIIVMKEPVFRTIWRHPRNYFKSRFFAYPKPSPLSARFFFLITLDYAVINSICSETKEIIIYWWLKMKNKF